VPRLRVGGAIPSLPQYIFMAWYLVKHREIFTFIISSSTLHGHPTSVPPCILTLFRPGVVSFALVYEFPSPVKME
jgi:hypothetical protein